MITAVGTAADTVRLFYAATPDAAGRRLLQHAGERLPLGPEARGVPRNNFHLTLAFVGNVPSADVPLLRDIGGALRAAPFALCIDAYEYWPKPEVIVAAARVVPAALEALWSELHVALAAHHWALDAKRLRPHVTLARKVAQTPVLPVISSFEWRVSEYCLMRSDSRDGQAVYTVVDTWPLLDKGGNAKKTL